VSISYVNNIIPHRATASDTAIHSPLTIDPEMLQEDGEIALASATNKGKGKEREEFDLAQVHSEQLESPMYPPSSEDAEETRQVEEVASDRLSHVCLIYSVG